MKKAISFAMALMVFLSVALCGCTKELKEDCKHNFTEEIKKQATCTENGEKLLTCTLCKGSKTEVIEAIGHDKESKVTLEPTCTAKGEKTITCKNCGEETKEEIPLTDHKFEKESLKDPTCTDTGLDLLTCTVCGAEKESKSKALGHNYINKDTKKATCTQDGIRVSTCSRCDDSKTKTVSAYGHAWKNATCTSPKKCSNCGKTSGEKLGHKNNGSGNCIRCGKKISVDMSKRISFGKQSDYGDHYYINSAGGVVLFWYDGVSNLTNKTIKYCTVKLRFYNAVGDYAYCQVTGKSYKTYRLVGPTEPGGAIGIIEETVAWIPSCDKIVVEEITLEYMDGTIESGSYGYTIDYYKRPYNY